MAGNHCSQPLYEHVKGTSHEGADCKFVGSRFCRPQSFAVYGEVKAISRFKPLCLASF